MSHTVQYVVHGYRAFWHCGQAAGLAPQRPGWSDCPHPLLQMVSEVDWFPWGHQRHAQCASPRRDHLDRLTLCMSGLRDGWNTSVSAPWHGRSTTGRGVMDTSMHEVHASRRRGQCDSVPTTWLGMHSDHTAKELSLWRCSQAAGLAPCKPRFEVGWVDPLLHFISFNLSIYWCPDHVNYHTNLIHLSILLSQLVT